jgi:hypothetical protein
MFELQNFKVGSILHLLGHSCSPALRLHNIRARTARVTLIKYGCDFTKTCVDNKYATEVGNGFKTMSKKGGH